MKVLIIVTNTDTYPSGNFKTGLWLSELTHLYHSAAQKGYHITLASPKGGFTPLDPESLKPFLLDSQSKGYLNDKSFMMVLKYTKSLEKVADETFDCIFMTGGHGTMFDFPDNDLLQQIIRKHYENGKLVAAVCHGVCALLNVKLSNGEYLVKDKKMTGFSWFEETLAKRKKEVPFNLEDELKKRGAHYTKALIPMTSKVCEDGNLVTGQNPFSSKAIAEKIMQRLNN